MVVPQVGPWGGVEEQFRWAEEVGYDVAYVYDHLTHPTLPGEWLADAFTTLGAAAMATSRIGLGTLVASATLHSPVSLARRAATVQDVSGGRMVLGLGMGAPFDVAADRGEEASFREMHERWRDVVLGTKAVWSGEAEWTGDTRSFRGLQTQPLAEGSHAPFLLLAAHGPKSLRVAAEHADGWNTYGGPHAVTVPADEFWAELAKQVARMEQACADTGRERPLRRSLLLGFGKVQPTTTVATYTEAIARAADLGFGELVVYAPGAAVVGARVPATRDVHEAVLSKRDRL